MNLTVKNYENWSVLADVVVKVKAVYCFETCGRRVINTNYAGNSVE